jgi:hypothetical protein
LRRGILSLHPTACLLHFGENSNCVGNQIGRTIAFESRDQLSLTLDSKSLVEDMLFADLFTRVSLSKRC